MIAFDAYTSGETWDRGIIPIIILPNDEEMLSFMVVVKHALEQGMPVKKSLLTAYSDTYYSITKTSQLTIYQKKDAPVIMASIYVFDKRKVAQLYQKFLVFDKIIFADYLESIGEKL